MEPLVVKNISDLDSVRLEPYAPPLEVVEFRVQYQSHAELVRFIRVLMAKTFAFERVQEVRILESDLYWETHSTRILFEWIAVLPNLRCFVWDGGGSQWTDPPIPLLTSIVNHTQNLETIRLSGLCFLTSPIDNQTNNSRTLESFCQTLKSLPNLKLFRCVGCSMRVMDENTTIRDTFVDHVLNALVFLASLECIDIRVAPLHEDDPGRVLLGLLQDGEIANAGLARFEKALQQSEEEEFLHQKIRLWIADSYEIKDKPQLLINLSTILARNTISKDFRVRGSERVAEEFVTEDVIDAYKGLLESGDNVTLTGCDLMAKQGDQIDFYCRLNEKGRGELLQRLKEETTTREQWVEEVLLRFVNDLDALFYWNQLYPVFLTSAD